MLYKCNNNKNKNDINIFHGVLNGVFQYVILYLYVNFSYNKSTRKYLKACNTRRKEKKRPGTKDDVYLFMLK